MRPLLHIRKVLLGLTQTEMADLTGVSQATVSRWESETGGMEPSRTEMESIRNEAIRRGCKWNDSVFFAVHAAPEAPAPREHAGEGRAA